MKLFKRLKKESGAYTVLTAIIMTVMVGFLALSIDIGYHYYRGAQLQNAADAAATAVANNLGSSDIKPTTLNTEDGSYIASDAVHDIAYNYLAKNGFSEDEKEWDKKKIKCRVYMKGVTSYETVVSENYITGAFYKLDVSVEDTTFFAKVLGINNLTLHKTAYCKADARYVEMPKALNYTVFAASTKDVILDPEKGPERALQINGKTGGIANSATSLAQNLINGMNTWIVKPVQAFYIDINGWNPFRWNMGFDWDDTNSWEAKLYTSSLTTSGDVHSNSNIESNIQAIHAARIQDADFSRTLSYKQLADVFNVGTIPDITPTQEDYGQVTFDAVKRIYFNHPKGVNLLGTGDHIDTFFYVQNPQYIEKVQLALRILNIVKDAEGFSAANFKETYTNEANKYFLLRSASTVGLQNEIINMANNDEITYDPAQKKFNILNQANIIYSVNIDNVNDTLARVRENGIMSITGSEDDYADRETNGINNLTTKGLDKLFDTGTHPYYAVKSASVKPDGDNYDNRQDLNETVNFVSTSNNGTESVVASASITGNNINREYQDFDKEAAGDQLTQWFNAVYDFFHQDSNVSPFSPFNKTVLPETRLGADFAIARTFVENSDYIETPNLKPYFIRQINRSIKNATKIRERMNDSRAGQPTIRYAAKERTDTLNDYLGARCTSCGATYNDGRRCTGCDKYYSGYIKDDNTWVCPSCMTQNHYRGKLEPGQQWTCTKCNAVNNAFSYFDNKYKTDEGTQALDKLDRGNTYLFREFKDNPNARVQNLKNAVKSDGTIDNSKLVTYSRKTQDGLTYNVSISRDTYKGYKLYNSEGALKTPKNFYNEELNKLKSAISLDGADNQNYTTYTGRAIRKMYRESENDFNAVENKKTDIKNNSVYNYSTHRNGENNNYSVKKKIEDVTVPTINNVEGASTVIPKIKVTGNTNGVPNHNVPSGTTAMNAGLLVPSSNILYNAFNGKSISTTASAYISAVDTYIKNTSIGGKTGWRDWYFNYQTYNSDSHFNVTDDKLMRCKWNGDQNDNDFHRIWKSGESKKLTKYYSLWWHDSVAPYEAGDDRIKGNNYSGGRGFIVSENTYLYLTDYMKTGSTNDETLSVRGALLVGGASTTTDGCAVYSAKDIQVGKFSDSSHGAVNNCFLASNGSVKANGQFYMGVNSFAIIQGNLNANTIELASGAVLIVNGNITSSGTLTNNGTIICTGSITFNGAGSFSGGGITYAASVNAGSNNISVSGGHKLYTVGAISFNQMTVNGAYVHAGTDLTASYNSQYGITVTNSSIVEAIGTFNVLYYSVDASSTLNVKKGFNLEGCAEYGEYVSTNNYNGKVLDGSKEVSSVNLDNSFAQINGDLKVNGNLVLTNNSVLVITGRITGCQEIILSNSAKLYVLGNNETGGSNTCVKCTKVTMSNNAFFLVRQRSKSCSEKYVITHNNSGGSIVYTLSGGSSGGSKLYVDGTIDRAQAVICSGNSVIYGYKALNLVSSHPNADDTSSGYFGMSGSASGSGEIFCGPDSTFPTGDNRVGINIAAGSLYLPEKSIKYNKFLVSPGGRVVVDGDDESPTTTLNANWFLIENQGTLVNHGVTKIDGCLATNRGEMYFLGGSDFTSASASDMTGDVQQSNPSYFQAKGKDSGVCETYIGKLYNGTTPINGNTLTYKSNYEAWGNVYFDCNVNVYGKIQDKNPTIGSEKGGKDMYEEEGIRVGHLGTAVYIPKGTTYVNGNITTYSDTSKDSGIYIGKWEDSVNDRNAGLVVNGNINLATAVLNYGKVKVRGAFNINNATPQKVTEKNDNKKYGEGKSIVNGRNEGSSSEFLVYNYNATGNILNTSATVNLLGYVQNYGKMIFNYNTTSVCGYNNEVSEIAGGDCAFINYAGSEAHFGGAVRLNSNQLYNKQNAKFSCDGKLTFGGCLYNCGTLVTAGDITNNVAKGVESDKDPKYLEGNYSLMNGFYKEFNNDYMYNDFVSYIYPSATIFCGGKMELGATETGGESGSFLSCGTVYINNDLNVYTNASRLSISSFSDFINIFKNQKSHSFYRTAIYTYDNSNTFVGGNCFAGAAVATGRDSIFMTGGEFRAKRALKLGEKMGMVKYTVFVVNTRYAFTFGRDQNDDDLVYNTGKSDSNIDSIYNSAYFYVGKNALINTIGSGLKSWVGATGTTPIPLNNSRDIDIYPNSNIYIGGSLYANAKVYMKDNTDMVVDGKYTFYKSNGTLDPNIQSTWKGSDNFVPEKLANSLTVKNHLALSNDVKADLIAGIRNNKIIKFYVYQNFDMSPNSSMIVNGAMQVNETAKIRDMTKSYVYGSYTCGKYVEIGKSSDDKDFTNIVNFDGSGEHIATDSSGKPMYLSESEEAIFNTDYYENGKTVTGEEKLLRKYEFDKAAYMFVDGDFTSGQDLGTGALNLLDKIVKWFTNTFASTGYTKIYASSALKVNGNLNSSRYITLRHDAKAYCRGDMTAKTSIEGAIYTECYVGGNMEAATSVTTKVIDSLGGLFNITKRGKIEFADQSRIIVGGNMFSSANITLGALPSGSYTRGRKSNYTVTASEGSNSYYENESDFEESKIITYDGNNYMDKSGAALYLDGKKYKYSDYDEEFAHQDNVIVYNSNDGKYHQKTYDGTVVNYDDGTINDDVSGQGRGVDGNNGLVTTDENTYGAEAFIGGTMIALNGFIKEHAYTCAVVGEYVYAPDYITLRSNADLWVLPETFDNATYEFVPYANKPDGNEYVYTCPHGHRVVSPTKITNARTPCKYCDATCAQCNPDDNTLPNTVGRIYLDLSTEEVQQGPKKSWFARLFETITYNIGKFGYETTQNFMFQPGSVYTFGSLTVNKNASLMGTNNLLQLGAITHGDGSPASNLENAISTIMGTAIGTVTQRKVTLAEDSLVLFGKDISITSAPVSLQLDFFKTKSWAGFDSKGTAGAGVRYICNNWRDPKHANCQYAMTFTAEEASKLTHLTCDVCGAEIWKEGDPNPGIPSQISHPAVMYAGNNLTIVTTVDMLMTYLIADQGEVNLTNFYTKSTHDVNNLKELPNAICSYNKNINYNAWVGQLSSLFYAPVGNINFDGIYTDIYGSVIGNSVQMNAYFQNFHRFENWRTMDLHVAESGSVYMITNHIWDAAPQLGGVYDLTSDSKYEDSPYGVRIFF